MSEPSIGRISSEAAFGALRPVPDAETTGSEASRGSGGA